MIASSAHSLRDRHRAATIDIILSAVGQCLSDTVLSDLTFAQVALHAQMGERTIYRHFPTKEALLNAWWVRHKEEIGQPEFPDTPDAIIAFPRRAFPLMDEQAQIMRGAVLSPQGRAMTLAQNQARQDAMLAIVAQAAPSLSSHDRIALAAVLQLLQSATAWLTMRDYWALSGQQSGAAASQAIKTLLAAAARGDFNGDQTK